VQEEWPSGGNGVTTAHSKSGGNSVALQLLRRLQSTTVLCSTSGDSDRYSILVKGEAQSSTKNNIKHQQQRHRQQRTTTAKTGEQANDKVNKHRQQHLSSGGGKIAASGGRGCYRKFQ